MIEGGGRNHDPGSERCTFHLFQSPFALSLTEQVDYLYAVGGLAADCAADRGMSLFPHRVVAAAESEAARIHLAGVVAVVDDGGWPILVERMDHAAYLASVELAPGKARTAALFKTFLSGPKPIARSAQIRTKHRNLR